MSETVRNKAADMHIASLHGTVAPMDASSAGLARLREEIEKACGPEAAPLRLAITDNTGSRWRYEIEVLRQGNSRCAHGIPSIFSFRRRTRTRTDEFNAAMIIPTGIDCAIGGHAGDATPAVRLIAQVCDQLVIHPNAVNASDINEQTESCLYVEGSLLCRLLMGDISLRKVRSNRILVVTESREDSQWPVDQVANSSSAARATLGADCVKVVVLKDSLNMAMETSLSGRSVGGIAGLESLCVLLDEERPNFDAVAISTRITADADLGRLISSYFRGNSGPNPWGGVEAALTHTVSMAFNVPSAHAPTVEDMESRLEDFGRVDPRKAAEVISTSFMFCVLKGLHRAPAVLLDPDGVYDPSVIAAEDISCLIIPDGVLGMPVLAALLQGITVIAVKSNTNLMKNDLERLPFAPGRLFYVENYLEAAGLIVALKAGISPASLSRPLLPTPVQIR